MGIDSFSIRNFYKCLASCSADVWALYAHFFDGAVNGKTVTYIRVRGRLANRLLHVLRLKSSANYLPPNVRPLINVFYQTTTSCNPVFITDEFEDMQRYCTPISEDFDTTKFIDIQKDIERLEALLMPSEDVAKEFVLGLDLPENIGYPFVVEDTDYRFAMSSAPTGEMQYDLVLNDGIPASVMYDMVLSKSREYTLYNMDEPDFVNDVDVVAILAKLEAKMLR